MDNLRSTPISAAFLSRSLPPHLRPLLTARTLLPRIGGAAFMLNGHASLEQERTPPRTSPTAAAAAARSSLTAEGSGLLGAAAAPGAAAAAALPAVAADATATVAAAAANKDARPLPKPPVSPQGLAAGAAAAGTGGAGRRRAISSSGSVTPPAGASLHAGLLYKQGSVGAAMVAEALRQELAEQLQRAAGGHTGPAGRGRSRSLSPLPSRHSRGGSRSSLVFPEASSLISPFADPAAGGQPPPQGAANGAAPAAGTSLPPAAPLFPGLPRHGSGTAPSSGTSTPRLRTQLPPPPPRRSTNIGRRVQEQVGCCC